MKAVLLISIFLYSTLCCTSQSINIQLVFTPSHPEINKSIEFRYYPQDSALSAAPTIYGILYVTGIDVLNKAEGENYPKVYELLMKKEGTGWTGIVPQIPAFATSLTVNFTDSLGHIDNNSGEGYWVPIVEDGHPAPGALSGKADMHAGAWDASCYGLKKDLSFARKLFEEDFRLHPEMKRNFIRSYLNTFDVNDIDDKKRFLSLLEEYASYQDLTEWDLLNGISGNYVRVNDIKSAEKYKKLVFEKFPNGSWSLQTNSLKLAMPISGTKDVEKQKAIYFKYISEFHEPYPDEFTRRLMTGRQGRILAEMAPNFSKNGSISEWKQEVENLKDDEFKIYAYSRAVGYIIKEHQENGQGKKSANQPEENITVYPINLGKNMLSDAENLASQAVVWWTENLMEAPRRWVDQPFFTDLQIRLAREGRLAELLDQQGELEAMQNKYDEALVTLRDASVKWGKRNNPTINEHYIETLIKAGKREQVLNEMELIIKHGKSTKRIDEFYLKFKNEKTDIGELKEEYYKGIKKRLSEGILHESAPKFELTDLNGNLIDIAAYRGKIIVVDFWATWCPPCMESLSVLEEAAEKYKTDSNVVFLFINVDVYRSRATEYMKEKAPELNYVFDKDNETIRKFSVNALPTKIIIDENGTIKFRSIGLLGGRQEQIDELNLMIDMAGSSK